jgi:hypothetical protein
MRQRMKQNAVVTNFVTTLKGDLQKAMQELEEVGGLCASFKSYLHL